MWMFTEFCCAGAQPTVASAPLAFSWMFFFGLYGPLKPGARIQSPLCGPQSLYGTPSRPTVQSSRGSSDTLADAFASKLPSKVLKLFESVTAIGRPFASTRKWFTSACDGWWKPQHPKWLLLVGKLSRSPQLELFAFGSPSATDAWNARIVSFPFSNSLKPVHTRSKLASSAYGPLFFTSLSVAIAAWYWPA